MKSIQELRILNAWGASDRRAFYELMANFVSDGVPVYESVVEIGTRWTDTNNIRHNITDNLLGALRGHSGTAQRFGQAIAKWVPSMEAMAIDAGEQAGSIADGLRMAARLSSVLARIKNTLISEMIYPGFLLVLFGVFLMTVHYKVIPAFEEIAPRAQWTSSLLALAWLGDNAVLLFILFIMAMIGIGASFIMSRGVWVGQTRAIFDQWIPPWSIHRQITGAVLMTCIGALVKSGVPFSSVLSKLAATASPWDMSHLDRMKNKMRRGMRDGDAMAGPLFDEDVRWEIGVYGRLTSFALALESLSERVVERVITRISSFSAIVRTGVMFLVAGLIVWVYGSFFAIAQVAKRAASMTM